jgi:hypothetical protein
MLKHSPAPWRIEPGEEPEEREIWDANLQCVATVHGPPEAGHAGPEQDQLNVDARLIAAAPLIYAMIASLTECKTNRQVWHLTKVAENLLNEMEGSR